LFSIQQLVEMCSRINTFGTGTELLEAQRSVTRLDKPRAETEKANGFISSKGITDEVMAIAVTSAGLCRAALFSVHVLP